MMSSNRITASIVTMGCAKNEVDSSHMAQRLAQAGIDVVEDPQDADAVVVNTCSFIQAATEESIEVVFQMLGMDNVEHGDAKVIVAGCMPARYGDDLAASLHEVDAFVPCSQEDDIAAVIARLFPEGEVHLDDAPHAADAPGGAYSSLGSDAYSAYVKISDGCDRLCSYCAIPSIRGRYHSFTYEQVRANVAANVAAGAREVVLIAQDTGRWGADLPGGRTLAWLMGQLAEEFSETWLRVMYLQPEGITDELLDCMAAHDTIASYLDIPLQHVDPDILRAMNRHGSYEAFIDLVERLRTRIPGIALRTTLIAGYPGETEAQFERLCDFVEEAEFDYVGVFPYSQEEGTRAATLPGQLDDRTKRQRAAAVRDIADAVSELKVRERVGEAMDVLVLGREPDGQLYGRALCQAPEVDGVVYLDAGTPGEVRNVTITGTLMYEMEGE
jgi:ribosomal protein S12 methylthiotransferase